MSDKNGWIAILILTAGLAALAVFGGFQHANMLSLTENWAAQSIEVEALRRSDLLHQRQLAAYAEENAALKKRLNELGVSPKGEIDDLRASQKSEFDELRASQKKEVEEFRANHRSEIDALTAKLNAEIGEIRGKQDAVAKLVNVFALKDSEGQNVFVGLGAGPRADPATRDDEDRNAGSFNTALGTSSLALNQTGAWNAAVGTSALGSNRAGSNNVAAGSNALGSNNSGSANVAVGSAAMYRNLTGAHNSAVGMQALYNLEAGDHNSAFGRDSLFTIKKGSWNSAFGVDSLPGLELGEGNSAFGGEAGYTENRDYQHRLGSFNSWFGYQSGPATLKQVSNSIAIGYRAKNTDSNQTVIGNKETKETIVFGALKIDRLCVGAICADAQSFAAMLQARKGR